MNLKRTRLYGMHKKHGGKLIDFGGWELPVQYEGIIKEHHMVRQKAGLFDVSHMGEIIIKGEKAEDFVQYMVTNDVKALKDHQVQYALMCYPDGGVVDDLIIYKFSDQHYLLVVNASNTDKDFDWLKQYSLTFGQLSVENVSNQYSQLALQGPKAEEILQKICDIDLKNLKHFWFNPQARVAGSDCIISRTGYTGEDGFEIYLTEQADVVWEEVLKAGGEDVAPIGLGARDTLRFEAKLPLYGQEIDQDISPLEAGLGFFVKLDTEEDFIGKTALKSQKENGLGRVTVQFEMIGKGIPRSHYKVQKDGIEIGWVTSGAFAPTQGKNIGLAIINREYNQKDSVFDIMIRGKKVPAKINSGIFYKRNQ
jgi:aminomethyltransferase